MSSPLKIALGAQARKNVVRVLDAWYVVCRSEALADRPLPRMVLGVPLVLFRDKSGRAAALLDRCPHRNVPLSLGSVDDGELKCRYHGWRFDCDGKLRAIPGLPIVDAADGRPAELDAPGRRCMA